METDWKSKTEACIVIVIENVLQFKVIDLSQLKKWLNEKLI